MTGDDRKQKVRSRRVLTRKYRAERSRPERPRGGEFRKRKVRIWEVRKRKVQNGDVLTRMVRNKKRSKKNRSGTEKRSEIKSSGHEGSGTKRFRSWKVRIESKKRGGQKGRAQREISALRDQEWERSQIPRSHHIGHRRKSVRWGQEWKGKKCPDHHQGGPRAKRSQA